MESSQVEMSIDSVRAGVATDLTRSGVCTRTEDLRVRFVVYGDKSLIKILPGGMGKIVVYN